jgi:hypothetical protein
VTIHAIREIMEKRKNPCHHLVFGSRLPWSISSSRRDLEYFEDPFDEPPFLKLRRKLADLKLLLDKDFLSTLASLEFGSTCKRSSICLSSSDSLRVGKVRSGNDILGLREGVSTYVKYFFLSPDSMSRKRRSGAVRVVRSISPDRLLLNGRLLLKTGADRAEMSRGSYERLDVSIWIVS